MPARDGVNPLRLRSEHYRPYGGVSIKHNGLWFRPPTKKPRVLAVRERFNTGPTPRHAILDFIHLLDEHPEVWALIG